MGREAGRRAPLAPLRARASASWKRRRVRARSRCSTVIASPAGRGAAAEGGPRSRLDSWERECACLEGAAGRERVDAAAAHLGRTAPCIQQGSRPPALLAADLPRPLSASRCLGRLWAATRREGSRARSLTPAGRAAKLLQLLIAMGLAPPGGARVPSGHFCARVRSRVAPEPSAAQWLLRTSAISTRRAAGCPPAPLGCVPAARGGSARPHSSSCSAGRHVTSGVGKY